MEMRGMTPKEGDPPFAEATQWQSREKNSASGALKKQSAGRWARGQGLPDGKAREAETVSLPADETSLLVGEGKSQEIVAALTF